MCSMLSIHYFALLLVIFNVKSVSTVSKQHPTPLKTSVVNISYHWEYRLMKCEKDPSVSYDLSQCALRSDNRNNVLGNGCYNEFVPAVKNIRNLCPLDCRKSDETTILGKSPTYNHRCSQFFNYGIAKVANDVFLWRSGTCLNTTVSFHIRCGFSFPAPPAPGLETLLTII
uniref:WSC domain-containing protein n=1 Tax=Steinernema glaseri TaxID=37863 RepID=A0A1I7YFA0_9BILA